MVWVHNEQLDHSWFFAEIRLFARQHALLFQYYWDLHGTCKNFKS